MLGLEITDESVARNSVRADRADRANRHRRESARTSAPMPSASATCITFMTWFELVKSATSASTARDRFQRLAHRSAIGRQRPSIDRHDGDAGAARLQSGDQIAIGDAVFLHRDSLARRARTCDASVVSTSRQVFGSGTTIAGSSPNSRNARVGFGPRTTVVICAERRDERRARRGASPSPGTARERPTPVMKNHDVEFAREQALGEIERRVIVFERNLAHRGRDDRDVRRAARSSSRFLPPSGFRTRRRAARRSRG